jgi:hypothetical protein
MNTLKQLIREFWLPLLLAGTWTAYALFTDPLPIDLKSFVKTFGPAFFLVSWATGQFIRVSKQARVDTNLRSIQERIEHLLDLIEARTKEIVAQITGGDSFCYVSLFNIDYQAKLSGLIAINGGTHTVFDANARIGDLDCYERSKASKGAISWQSCELDDCYSKFDHSESCCPVVRAVVLDR